MATEDELAADGDDVVEGVDPPTLEEKLEFLGYKKIDAVS